MASPPVAADAAPPSLEIVLRQILEKLAADDSFFPTAVDGPDLRLPGKRTPELQALEGALHGLVARVQDLEARHSSSSPVDVTPVPKQLQSIKENENGVQTVCRTCGHRLDNVPLTPEETPPMAVDTTGPHVPRRIPSSMSTPNTLLVWCRESNIRIDSTMSGYDSSASDTTTFSSADSIALAAQNVALKAEIRYLEQKSAETARVSYRSTIRI